MKYQQVCIGLLEDHDHLRRIFKIDFFGVSSGQPIISKTAKNFDVEINVLFGNMTELQGHSVWQFNR